MRSERSGRELTIRYVVGLSLIATLAVLGYGVERARRPRASDARVILIANEQLAASREITRIVSASNGSANRAADVERGIEKLQAIHRQLRAGDLAQGIPPEDDPDTLIILDRLDQDLEEFLGAVRMTESSDAAQFDDRHQRLRDAEGRLFATNSVLVRRYADMVVTHLTNYGSIELGLTVAIVIVLFLQGMFVFAPAVRRVRDAMATLEDAQAALALTAAIVESSGDAIARTSLSGDIQTWNHGAENIFGVPASNAIGKNITSLLRPGSSEMLTGALARVAAGEPAAPFDAVAGSSGHRTDISMLIAPIPNADGRIGSVSIIGRDVTDRVQAQRMKSDFVSFVSHQLRTPLAGVKWMLELAADTPDMPETVTEYISDARASADRLIHLVNDLLDVSRLEEGRLTLTPQPVQLDDITRSVMAEFEGLAQQKSITVGYRGSAECTVMADAQLMRQAIGNLYSNAIKYTPARGRIDIDLSRSAGHVEWRIHDTGIGIPAAAQSRLFEKFFRADNALIIETEGTGLGLYLVRLIVNRVGGAIRCESEEGRGTTFIVTLPIGEAA